eukprot:GDKJ01013161.1.p1 GENE.GDKJ01013161.1~~GDKJ01013161.1.p1  ORF type:complete len:383 (-),score=72.51 GDKJ01013161.1:94-1113(-)
MEHQIAALVEVGVDHIVLAINYQPDAMLGKIKALEDKYKVRISCSKEDEPMGTGGPIRLAREILLEDDDSDSFFVFNSDVICDYPLKDMLDFHRASGAKGTVAVTPVEEPSRFGVVVSDDNGRILRFVEKPKQFVGNQINAGLYILNKSVIDTIENRPTSIERETFPAMVDREELYKFSLKGYWADVGQPADFIKAQAPHINAVASRAKNGTSKSWDAPINSPTFNDVKYIGNNIIDPSAQIGKGSVIGPNVVIGPGVIIGEGCRITNSTLLDKVKVDSYAVIVDSIVGWTCKLGGWSFLQNAVLGEDITVKSLAVLNGTKVLPHKEVGAGFVGNEIVM